MSLTLYETVQRIVQQELGQVRTAELALVREQHSHSDSSDNENYTCTVELRNSALVLKRVPVATSQIGAVSIPDVGELVLVQFIGGDINSPVITGCLYNDQDRPPKNSNGQNIMHLPLAAGDDDAVHIELNSGDKREINIKLGSGLEVKLKDDDPAVELNVGGGNATLSIAKDGGIKVDSKGDISIHGNQVKIEADSTLTLKGQSAVNIN